VVSVSGVECKRSRVRIPMDTVKSRLSSDGNGICRYLITTYELILLFEYVCLLFLFVLIKSRHCWWDTFVVKFVPKKSLAVRNLTV